mmetsp:Transcript_27046/g.54716  ORF Transcript_27046/g.54716 Transcript_27046/m.54716 type:complete len:203 (-) Transcript_27046:48-656(-)
MAGLTWTHTNYTSWGNGRDWFITGDKFYQGGKEAWRKSGTTGILGAEKNQSQERRPRRRTQSSFGLQVSANGDVGAFMLPAQAASRPSGRSGEAHGPVHAPPTLRAGLRATSSSGRWRSDGAPPPPPAKTLDTHHHFERWLGMHLSPISQDTAAAVPGRRKSPPVGASRRQAAMSSGFASWSGPGLVHSASAPSIPMGAHRS